MRAALPATRYDDSARRLGVCTVSKRSKLLHAAVNPSAITAVITFIVFGMMVRS
jgi:hypothetical protein